MKLNLSSQCWSPSHWLQLLLPVQLTWLPGILVRLPSSQGHGANCPPLPASMQLINTPGRDNRLQSQPLIPWLVLSSFSGHPLRHCWWWASLGGSRLRWSSSFGKNTCLKSQVWQGNFSVYKCGVLHLQKCTWCFARHKIQPPFWGPQLAPWIIFVDVGQLCHRFAANTPLTS